MCLLVRGVWWVSLAVQCVLYDGRLFCVSLSLFVICFVCLRLFVVVRWLFFVVSYAPRIVCWLLLSVACCLLIDVCVLFVVRVVGCMLSAVCRSVFVG